MIVSPTFFAIFDGEMLHFKKSWNVSFFLWRRWWWCTKTVSSPTFAGAARPALHLRVHPAALPTQDNLLRWLATLPGPRAGFPRMQLRLRHLARFLVACTLCINSEKAWLVLLSVQRFCAMCKTFARLVMSVKFPFPVFSASILARAGKVLPEDSTPLEWITIILAQASSPNMSHILGHIFPALQNILVSEFTNCKIWIRKWPSP